MINKDLIIRETGRDIGWEELLHEDFLRMPAGMADLNDTLFHSEINSSADRGRLVIRYGLLPSGEQQGSPLVFKFDCDRFLDASISIDGVGTLAEVFVEDIYQAFSYARGQALTEWMQLQQVPGEKQ